MQTIYNQKAPKKATNLSINSDLLKKARELNMNLSSLLEQTLIENIKRKQEEQWLESNKEAIEVYNKHAEQHGVFSEGIRSF